jgi:hypothetical protein
MARFPKFSKVLCTLTSCSKFTRALTFQNFCKIPTLAAQSHALIAGAEDMGGDRNRLSQSVGAALDPDTGRMISRSVIQSHEPQAHFLKSTIYSLKSTIYSTFMCTLPCYLESILPKQSFLSKYKPPHPTQKPPYPLTFQNFLGRTGWAGTC